MYFQTMPNLAERLSVEPGFAERTATLCEEIETLEIQLLHKLNSLVAHYDDACTIATPDTPPPPRESSGPAASKQHRLLELIGVGGFDVLICLADTLSSIEDGERLVQALFYFFDTIPRLVPLLKVFISHEIATTESRHLLFCRYKVPAQLLSRFLLRYGQPYLISVLGPFVREICAEEYPGFMVQTPAGKDDTDEQRMEVQVLGWSLRILEAVLMSTADLPTPIKVLFTHLRVAMTRQFASQNRLQTAPVIVYMFIRFIIVALTEPSAHGILPGPTSTSQRRVLIAVGKKIQALATWIVWPDQNAYGSLFRDNAPQMNAFVNEISSSTDDVAGHAPEMTPKPENEDAMKTICEMLTQHTDEVTKALASRGFSPEELMGVVRSLREEWGAAAPAGSSSETITREQCMGLVDQMRDKSPDKKPLATIAYGGATSCFTGQHLLKWLMENTEYKEHYFAFVVAQKLMEYRLMNNVVEIGNRVFNPDETMYRFQEDEPSFVLNRKQVWTSEARPALVVAEDLLSRMLHLFDSFSNLRNDVLGRHLKLMRQSESFRSICLATAELQNVVLAELHSNSERLAFYLNVFNLACMHAAVLVTPPAGAAPRYAYLKKASYQVGELGVLTLNQLEHAVIRASMPKPIIPGVVNLFPKFPSYDSRLNFVVTEPDARVTFAICYGAVSSPPVRIYWPEALEQQLYQATCVYLQENCTLSIEKKELGLPEIVQFNQLDIGKTDDEMLAFVTRFLAPSSRASVQSLSRTGDAVILKFKPYNWHLFYSVTIENRVLQSPTKEDITPPPERPARSASVSKPVAAVASSPPREPLGVPGPRAIPKSPEMILPQLPPSAFITPEMFAFLYRHIPSRYIDDTLVQLFNTADDGYNILTLYQRVKDIEPILLVFKTTKRKIFGAFLSTGLQQTTSKDGFCGTGESFVFTLFPHTVKYAWMPGRPEFFVRGNVEQLTIGGGGIGYAITIDSDLCNGASVTCQTFNNPPLCDPDKQFSIIGAEAYGFSSECL